MHEHPWSADRELTTAQVRRAITSQFDDVRANRVIRMGSGWDNDVYVVDDAWIFRFPRREEVAQGIEREIAASTLATEALSGLGVRVPEITRIGHPSESFPYRFVGYERLPGTPAEDVPARDSDCELIGERIGEILTRLHAISAERAARAGLAVDDDGVEEWRAEALRIASDLADREGPPTRSCIDWLLDGPPTPPPYGGPVRFLHNDICPEHILLEPGRRRITALLDFGDACLGDAALDFVMLPAWLGPAGTKATLASYEPERDAGFEQRIAYLGRVTSLTSLHDAHLQGADVTKHRQWVQRAFAMDC